MLRPGKGEGMSESSLWWRRRFRLAVATLLSAFSFVAGVAVMPAARAAQVSLQVSTWNVDTSTGKIAYEVSVAGSCEMTCYWRVEAFYRDGTTEKLRFSLGSGTLYGNSTTPAQLNANLTSAPTERLETTHVKATITRHDGSVLASSPFATVSELYPTGGATLNVAQWNANHSSVPRPMTSQCRSSARSKKTG